MSWTYGSKIPHCVPGLTDDERDLLESAVTSFLSKAMSEGYHIPETAENNCDAASDEFVSELEKIGLDGFIEHYSFSSDVHPAREVAADLARFPFDVEEGVKWHWAVRVGDSLIIDWTARQFSSSATFPCVWDDDYAQEDLLEAAA